MFKVGDIVLVNYQMGNFQVVNFPTKINKVSNYGDHPSYTFYSPPADKGNPNWHEGQEWGLAEIVGGKNYLTLKPFEVGDKVVIVKEMENWSEENTLPKTIGMTGKITHIGLQSLRVILDTPPDQLDKSKNTNWLYAKDAIAYAPDAIAPLHGDFLTTIIPSTAAKKPEWKGRTINERT